MRLMLRFSTFLIAMEAVVAPALQGMTITHPPIMNSSTSFPGTNADVELHAPATHISSASDTFQTTLAKQFPGWTFDISNRELAGDLTINTYNPIANATSGGALFDATYTRDATDPVLANLYFIQMVSTSDPLDGATSPYIDPYKNDDANGEELPFFHTRVNASEGNEKNSAAGTYHFRDQSMRGYPTPPAMPPMRTSKSWMGELLLASWDGTVSPTGLGTVTVYDGVQWGWSIQQYASSTAPSGASQDKVLAVATPEPSSIVMLLTGFVPIGWILAKRRGS